MAPLTPLELDIVRLQHSDGLCTRQIAKRLGLHWNQVRYRLRKKNVCRYVEEVIKPAQARQRIEQIMQDLADPIEAYSKKLQADLEQQTYQWVGVGQRAWQPHWKHQQQALRRLSRLMGTSHDQKNVLRDLRTQIQSYTAKLQAELSCLERSLENDKT